MAMAKRDGNQLTIIEHCRVSPPPNVVPTSPLPLTFFDIPWMSDCFVEHVLFYEFPASNPKLLHTVIPALRSSISAALEKFYPLAAKVLVPPLPGKPQIIYSEGDSIPFTVAESMVNFHELTSNDPQDVKLLHPMVPQIMPWHTSKDGICTITPLLAIQVTLFPNSGFCLGIRYNHTVCDGKSFLHFLKSWASICRTGDHQIQSLPFLDRVVIEDPDDIQTSFLKVWWDTVSRGAGSPPRQTDKRATFALSRATINRLKTWISNRSTVLGLQSINISSFSAVCAFVWVCIERSASQESDIRRSQLRHFSFVGDCRGRLETPFPDETYFGNCLVPRVVAVEENVLLGQDGTVFAARGISEKVKELESGGALNGVETSMSYLADIAKQFGPPLTVAGSPRLGVYDINFGWGKPRKSAMVHIDMSWSISLVESRDEDGGMEIELALTKIVVPPLPREPQFVYTDGDSVPFTVAESTGNFDEVTSNDPQDVKLVNPLVPQLPEWRISQEGICTITPLLAIQVTLFPTIGLCLGLKFNHVVCDGNGFQHFIKSWASICRTGSVQGPLPFLHRGIVEDPNHLKTTFLKSWWDVVSKDPNPSSPPICSDQRTTVEVSKTTIHLLKCLISKRSTELSLDSLKVSSFAAVCAFTWVCMVKSTPDSDESLLFHLAFLADCRRPLKTPLPEKYFGNCLVGLNVEMEKKVLVGQEGIVLAANAITGKVKELENGGAERLMFDKPGMTTGRFGVPLNVAGSPWLTVYDTDFGWGRPKKSAVVHLSWSISLAESRVEEGGMEVGVALTKTSMDKFTSLFNQMESLFVN